MPQKGRDLSPTQELWVKRIMSVEKKYSESLIINKLLGGGGDKWLRIFIYQ